MIDLYSLATPNGQKVSIALEEMGLEYRAHKINIMQGDQFTEDFIKINPNSKIPAILDHDGPSGNPFALFESGAILMYLAEKSGKFLPKDPEARWKTTQWLFFQMGGPGPMFGQFGHFFKYAKDKCDHPYPIERYTNEAKRLLGVIEKQLETHKYIAGDEFTIADMSLVPWIDCLSRFYEADEQLELTSFRRVNEYVASVKDREKTQKGWNVCGFDS